MENYSLLAVISAVFLIPSVLALYIALRGSGRAPVSIAVVLALTSVALTLMVTLSVISAINLAQLYTSTASGTLRASYFAAAVGQIYLFANASALGGLFTSGALILAGYPMTKEKRFGKPTGYLGILAGVLGVLILILPWDILIFTSAISSVLSLIWVFIVGVQLIKFASSV